MNIIDFKDYYTNFRNSSKYYLSSPDDFEEMVKRNPEAANSPHVLLFMAVHHCQTLNFIKAKELLNKVLTDYPDSDFAGVAEYAIGNIEEKVFNNVEKAHAAYESVISKYPNCESAQNAQEALSRIASLNHK